MTIGEKIRGYRTIRNLTQKELGELTGISAKMIGHYENGYRMPSNKQLSKIADALDISTNLFADLKFENVTDIVTLLMLIDDAVGIDFSYSEDKHGHIISDSISIKFDDGGINDQLLIYIMTIQKCQKVVDFIKNHKDELSGINDENYNDLLAEAERALLIGKLESINSPNDLMKDYVDDD